jgi:ferritin-like metal-binding protein YciE
MRSLQRFFIRLINTMTRQRDDARLNDEIEKHLALETAENIRLLRLEPLFRIVSARSTQPDVCPKGRD